MIKWLLAWVASIGVVVWLVVFVSRQSLSDKTSSADTAEKVVEVVEVPKPRVEVLYDQRLAHMSYVVLKDHVLNKTFVMTFWGGHTTMLEVDVEVDVKEEVEAPDGKVH